MARLDRRWRHGGWFTSDSNLDQEVSVHVKAGVRFDVIAPAGYCILTALKAASLGLNVPLTITSGTDGEHSGPDDPHHYGEAYDVRSHDYDEDTKQRILDGVLGRLGDDFYGFVEASGTSNEHYHIQRRKGTTFDLLKWLSEA